MYTVKATNRFKKDLKTIIKRGYNTDLSNGKPLDEKYCDHALGGEWKGCRECHVLPDWLLIYKISGEELLLYLMRTGSHSDLF